MDEALKRMKEMSMDDKLTSCISHFADEAGKTVPPIIRQEALNPVLKALRDSLKIGQEQESPSAFIAMLVEEMIHIISTSIVAISSEGPERLRRRNAISSTDCLILRRGVEDYILEAVNKNLKNAVLDSHLKFTAFVESQSKAQG